MELKFVGRGQKFSGPDLSQQMPRMCPRCGGPVLRIRRRPIDRLLSLIRPVQRFQCIALECEWRGNLPRRPSLNVHDGAPMTTPTGTR